MCAMRGGIPLYSTGEWNVETLTCLILRLRSGFVGRSTGLCGLCWALLGFLSGLALRSVSGFQPFSALLHEIRVMVNARNGGAFSNNVKGRQQQFFF
jgi:hypothetical protein